MAPTSQTATVDQLPVPCSRRGEDGLARERPQGVAEVLEAPAYGSAHVS